MIGYIIVETVREITQDLELSIDLKSCKKDLTDLFDSEGQKRIKIFKVEVTEVDAKA